ncbi:RHS repeat domain-containing protein, partial [Bacteroides bouchesdurhonensis]|uniref:RHS repeat domain-containing protein n=1 Tax=Bacteroides bouchesdurhonensis TaxID=1841855 RepID=UPI0011DD3ABD
TESNEILKKYVYVYRYDKLNRCIYKKLPGCEPVYTVYDAADRPIFTQDGEQRTKGEWSFSIPDAFNRIVLTGTCKNNPDYTADPLKDIVVKGTWEQAAGAVKGYSISGITLNAPTVLSAVYYDSYDFLGKSNSIPNDATTSYAEVPGYGKRYKGGCRGQQTGSYIAKLSKTGAVTGYLYSVMYYDERYRMVQQRGNNGLGGTDLTCTLYSFTVKPAQVKQVRTVPGKETVTETRTHTYDHADRLLRTSYQLNDDAPVTLVDHVYDEVGRLKSDRRNGNGKLRSDYAYNVRSWTKSVSGPLFSQTLNYQEKMTGNTPCYNGNISSMSWKAGTETADRGYRFTYDGLSRLKDANYGEGNNLTINPNRFNEQITGYDKMGNILKLKRYGQTSATAYGLVDDLALTYSGNQLLAVKDNVTNSVYGNGTEFKDGTNQITEYTYDKNGNLIKDLNKNISSIGYNCLNLPDQVIFGNGNSVEYEYTTDGVKSRTVHKTGSTTLTTDYCGNAVYENGVLKMLLNEAGYVSFPDRKFHFYLKDHQGNIRVVADKDGIVEETNSYYPFGGMFTSTVNVQPYKYNGKELDQKNGLNWYDYGARHYDAAIGRWHVVDPMSEKYYSMSPYGYCAGSPVCHKDEEGKWINNVVGAVIGAAVDLGIQVTANLVQGNSAFHDIKWGNVGVSAVEGFVTSGMSAGKTLVVKATASIAKNTINAIDNKKLNNVNDALGVVTESVKDIAADKVIGKAGDLLGKGMKEVIPQLKEATQKGSSLILSNNKATQLAEELPGVSNVKQARGIAIKKNGIVDASKTISNIVQKAPENTFKFGMQVAKGSLEKDVNR